MKIAFFSSQEYDIKSFESFETEHSLEFFSEQLNRKTVLLSEGFNAVCVFVNDQLNSEVLQSLAAKNINCILLRCAGFNNVDIKAAKELNISVYRVPAYSPNAVAEHAVAIIQTLNRKTHKAYNRVREGNFSINKLQGFDLYNKTIGVIGTGKIGTVFCKIMKGFGAKILAFDPNPTDELISMGVSYVNIETIYSQSDVISLHCPLNNSTKEIINESSINQMKNGVMIINTSRGGLIDSTSIIKGLKNQKIGYFGIDVYEQEEHLFFKDLSETIIKDDEIAWLSSFPNVLITAHQGFFTNEAMTQIATTTLSNASQFENNIQSENSLT